MLPIDWSAALKITEGGVERSSVPVARAEAINLECVISEIGRRFYWASRANAQMTRVAGGAFVTGVALTAPGTSV